jgi:hypothetical protein
VPRGRSPEEFFEVFREVLDSKKKHGEEPDASEASPRGERPLRAAIPEPEELAPRAPLAERVNAFLGGTVTVSRTVVLATAVGGILLLLIAFLLGKQAGRGSRPAAAEQSSTEEPSAPEADADAAAAPQEPEFVEGKVFTLVTSGTRRIDRERIEAEAAYLNERSNAFRGLGVEAYCFRDKASRYRLCVRGLLGRSEADRDRVAEKIRKAHSSRGKLEFSQADFYAP